MNKNQLIGSFEAADVSVLRVWELPNGYDRTHNSSPWWLVKTHKGLIEVGYRKRVIQLDWSDTDIRKILEVPGPYVTQTDHFIHAKDYNDLIDYLYILFHT